MQTLPTPCTLLLRKRPHWSQLQLVLFTRSTARRREKSATCFAGRSINLWRRNARKLRFVAAGMMLGNSFRRLNVCLKVSSLNLPSARTKMDMVTDIKSSLEIWRAHFNATLNCDDTNNPANVMIRPSWPNTLDNIPVAPPDWEEWPWPFSGLNSIKPAVMMASLLNFLKQEEMDWFAACITFSATYGHWKACQVIGVLVCSAQYLKRAMLQSAAIIVA